MTTDLIKRLRERAARKWTDEANRSASLFGEAADEIERLRERAQAGAESWNALQRTLKEVERLAAERAATRDCRSCMNFTTKAGGCVALVQCVDADGFKPTASRQYWMTKEAP